jgi:hypothetical protein
MISMIAEKRLINGKPLARRTLTEAGDCSDDADGTRRTVAQKVKSLHRKINETKASENLQQQKMSPTLPSKTLKEIQDLASSETRRLCQWKVLIIVTIIVVAAFVSAGAYCMLSEQESDDYSDRVSGF